MANDEFVGITESAAILKVSRGRVSQLKDRSEFPAPVGTISAGSFWRRSDIEAYARSRAARVARHDGSPKRRLAS